MPRSRPAPPPVSARRCVLYLGMLFLLALMPRLYSAQHLGWNWDFPGSFTLVVKVPTFAPLLERGVVVKAGQVTDVGALTPQSLKNTPDEATLTGSEWYGEWQATEALSLQFLAEGGQDDFSSPTAYQEGVEKTKLNLFSIDGDYVLSEDWRLNGFISTGQQQLHQTRPAGYILSYKDTTTTFGLGFSGKAMANLQVGGNLAYMNSKNAYPQGTQPTTSPANVTLLALAGGLPDVIFRQTTLNLFGTYDIDKRSAVRVNMVYQYNKVEDWAWNYGSTPYAYSDGTTLYQEPSQSVGMIGVTYLYRF